MPPPARPRTKGSRPREASARRSRDERKAPIPNATTAGASTSLTLAVRTAAGNQTRRKTRPAHSARAKAIRQWSSGKNLVKLLRTLGVFPDFFGGSEPGAGQCAEKPDWFPLDASQVELERGYKRATRYVHPDRLHGRDAAVVDEAQEIMKVLTR